MSRTIDIFIACDTSIEKFAAELELTLGITLRRTPNGAEIYYEYRDTRVVLTVGTHSLENDRDMHFEDYPCHLAIRALNVGTEERRKVSRENFAGTIFQKLKATRRYRLMLVDDLQAKREEFDPRS